MEDEGEDDEDFKITELQQNYYVKLQFIILSIIFKGRGLYRFASPKQLSLFTVAI